MSMGNWQGKLSSTKALKWFHCSLSTVTAFWRLQITKEQSTWSKSSKWTVHKSNWKSWICWNSKNLQFQWAAIWFSKEAKDPNFKNVFWLFRSKTVHSKKWTWLAAWESSKKCHMRSKRIITTRTEKVKNLSRLSTWKKSTANWNLLTNPCCTSELNWGKRHRNQTFSFQSRKFQNKTLLIKSIQRSIST